MTHTFGMMSFQIVQVYHKKQSANYYGNSEVQNILQRVGYWCHTDVKLKEIDSLFNV